MVRRRKASADIAAGVSRRDSIMTTKRGFTVVELLIVITIFAITFALLTPFINRMRERADVIKCSANVRLLSLALHIYAADHDDAFPPDLGSLYPAYVKEEKAFDCPASKFVGTAAKSDYEYVPGLSESSKLTEVIIYDRDGKTTSGEILNGRISLSIRAGSLVTIKIKELVIDVPMFRDLARTNVNHTSTGQNFVRENTEIQSLGTITGMMLNLNNAVSDAYIFSDVSVNNVRSATLRYKIGDGKWQELTDPVYPYEFSIHLSDPSQKLVFRWVSQDKDGNLIKSKELELIN